MSMKAVDIADLRARLSEHLRSVRKGRSLTVLDRGTPIAPVVPVQADVLEVRRASRRPSDLPLAPPAPAKPTDSLAILLDDRDRR